MGLVKDSEDELLGLGLLAAGAYFFVVRPIMKDLGLSDADKQAYDDVVTTDPAANAFSPNFQPLIDNYSNNGTIQSQVQQMKELYDDGTYSQQDFDPNGYAGLANIAEQIYDSIGVFTVDDGRVVSMFKLLQTKAQVAFVAAYFAYNFNKDLFTYIRYGWNRIFNHGISSGSLSDIIKYVNSLPDINDYV